MNRHWNAHCVLSLVHFMAYPECQSGEGPILESVARIAEDDFFSGIEISRINDDQTLKQVADLLAQTHMQVAFGAQPVILGGKLNLNSADKAERSHAVNAVASQIQRAVDLGADRFVILSGHDSPENERAKATEFLIESILSLCAIASQSGIHISLETFDRAVDKRALIGPADEASALAAQIRNEFPDFGILYDMGHMPLLDETPDSALYELKPYLVHVHVGNCVKIAGRPSYGDLHPRFGFPGGENDVPQLIEFLRTLFDIGYLQEEPPPGPLPWVGFEMRPQAGETSAAILANLKRTWNEAWWRA
ncbi:sugar phosphate isomerase/epimerase [Anaerolineae bacterium CFX9]|nr:sugar phosphate isomerase/epimerase [Anaerolineae bacterium CFX9]